MEHISLVHAKYGSNHLQKELADTNADNDQSKNQNPVKFEDQVSFHIVQTIDTYSFVFNKSSIQYLVFKNAQLPFVLISSQGPPPKFS